MPTFGHDGLEILKFGHGSLIIEPQLRPLPYGYISSKQAARKI